MIAHRAHSNFNWTSVPPAVVSQDETKNVAPLDVSAHSALIRCLDKEIDDEKLRMDKEPPKLPQGWDIRHESGTSFFTMERAWVDRKGQAEKHFIRVQLTARDPSLDPECDIRGEHFPFKLLVERNARVVEHAMDVVEGELVVNHVKVYDEPLLAYDHSLVADFDRAQTFPGPSLDEAEEEVLDGLHAFLQEREFDDPFAEFIAHYSAWIEQEEYEQWLQQLRKFVTAV